VIVFETSAHPQARPGEGDVGGRRIAGRLLPYGVEAEGSTPLFDPLARRFARQRPETSVAVGPADAEAWRAAAARLPAGPLLVGPCSIAEDVRGAYRAAAEGALRAGRALFLLDPQPAGIPDAPADARVVALCSFARAGRDPFPALAASRAAGLACGVLFPLVPGWTAEPSTVDSLLAAAAAAGASAATPLLPDADGESRRAIVEARTAASPDATDDFFDAIHHQEWLPRMVERLPEVWRRCAAHGLSVLPPRPIGPGEPSGNAAASAHLEERAELDPLPEHRAALLRAAVRWIDESGRDLAAVAREGNFRRVFPFDGDVAAEAEAALRVATGAR
jgi:hypothetical protein